MFRYALTSWPLADSGGSEDGSILEPQAALLDASFGPRQISTPYADCGGFDVRFGGGSGSSGDRHVDQLLFETPRETSSYAGGEWFGRTDVRLGLRGGGAWNHRYTGHVRVVYVAVTGESAGSPTVLAPIEVAASVVGRAAGSGNVQRTLGALRFERRRILSAHVALKSFDAKYLDGDHHVQQSRVWLDAPRVGNRGGTGEVTVRGRFGMCGAGDFLQPFQIDVRALLLLAAA